MPQYAVFGEMNRSIRLGSASSATGEPRAANAVGSSSRTSVWALVGQPPPAWTSTALRENGFPPPTAPPSFQK